MKLSTILAFGALLLVDVSVAQLFRFRPEVLENNTTWPLKGALLKGPETPKGTTLKERCPMPRTSFLGKAYSWIIGNKKPKCSQFDIAPGQTLSGFPLFPTRQVHAFTFPNNTFILQSALPDSERGNVARKKNVWVKIPGGVTVTCYEGNEGLPHCLFRT
ncbi:hypothetical protein FAGAP_8945 [Fusarium agapanthi]|uniref:Uncharacterized protein n=1 Tax=Fusarium agapanthi TaxID=1803897 RepID=A0A9P5B3Z0_9HYPO|nr:hypothetical protein FAGAP_8945 [Fusarium agapanthi]